MRIKIPITIRLAQEAALPPEPPKTGMTEQGTMPFKERYDPQGLFCGSRVLNNTASLKRSISRATGRFWRNRGTTEPGSWFQRNQPQP